MTTRVKMVLKMESGEGRDVSIESGKYKRREGIWSSLETW